MIKIPERVEMLFAKAVALHQAGRLKSTVYLDKDEIYILNGDHTVLIRHPLPPGESIEGGPIIFNADDYEGALIENVDDQITFTKRLLLASEQQVTKVNAAIPETPFETVKALFMQFVEPTFSMVFDHSWLAPVRDDLSHIEFTGEGGTFHMKQRDIYAGRVYDTWREARDKAGFGGSAAIPDFGPMAARTGDLKVAMEFSASPTIWINPKDNTYFIIKDAKTRMTCIISCCLYDELAYKHERREASSGRKEPERRDDGGVCQATGGESQSGSNQQAAVQPIRRRRC